MTQSYVRSSLVDRVRFAALVGLFVGVCLCVWVTGIRIISGPSPFRRVGTTYSAALVAYLLGCTVSGVLIGCMQPIARSAVGKAVAGSVAVVPFWVAIALTTSLTDSLDSRIELALVLSAISGSYWGITTFYKPDDNG
jgi:hypothetical protein